MAESRGVVDLHEAEAVTRVTITLPSCMSHYVPSCGMVGLRGAEAYPAATHALKGRCRWAGGLVGRQAGRQELLPATSSVMSHRDSSGTHHDS